MTCAIATDMAVTIYFSCNNPYIGIWYSTYRNRQIIVNKSNDTFEILSGHNRAKAAKLVGMAEILANVKSDLSDEDCYVCVIETNIQVFYCTKIRAWQLKDFKNKQNALKMLIFRQGVV